jgi:hypothetical protein
VRPFFSTVQYRHAHPVFSSFFTGLTIKLDVLAAFVEDCRRRYLASSAPRVTIHLCDAFVGGADWAVVKTKPRRPLGSLALPDGVMDALLKDVREFLGAERWYADAGIPHHRGCVGAWMYASYALMYAQVPLARAARNRQECVSSTPSRALALI